MEYINKKHILESIERVHEKANGSKLKQSFFQEIDTDLSTLSKYFNSTKSESFFIALVFAISYEEEMVDWNSMATYLNSSSLALLKFSEDFEHLLKKGILIKHGSGHQTKLTAIKGQYSIHEDIIQAILKGLPLPIIKTKKKKLDNIINLLEDIYSLGKQCENEEISTAKLLQNTEELITLNSHFPLVKRMKELNFNLEDTFIFLFLTRRTILNFSRTGIEKTLEDTYDNPIQYFNYLQRLLSDEHPFTKYNLAKIVDGRIFIDPVIEFTNEGLELLAECGVKVINQIKESPKDIMGNNSIILPDKVTARQLIFEENEMKQLGILKNLLQHEHLVETQEKLVKKGLPPGITVLLHGAPGTGKTEIVKQLAKETQREIIKVEISEARSKWYGESEKLIKGIFTNYKTYMQRSERTPILLFNEADAIIHKRGDSINSHIKQVENNIQNILLEEIENFEGILIATTNLVKNLDFAFERRFLFKIPFHKPNRSIRAKIWKAKMPRLKLEKCNLLAERFDFSGGQIDNIIRKCEIQEILNGTSASFNDLLSFCEEETFQKVSAKIGFNSKIMIDG